MGLDINLIRNRLNTYSQTSNKKSSISEHIWKPTPGNSTIRILPNKYSQNYPFVELSFYYFIKNRPFLCPAALGHADPIMEKIKLLENTGDYNDRKLARQIRPKLRIFAPVFVRGKEYEGVKVWGFGTKVHQSLLTYMDGEYGDITDLQTGTDLIVTYVKGANDAAFPTTQIMPKRNTSLAFDPNDTKLRDLFQNQVNIRELFVEPTYEELQEALEHWLNPDGSIEPTNTTSNTFGNFDTVKASQNPFEISSQASQPAAVNNATAYNPSQPSTSPTVDDRFKDMFA